MPYFTERERKEKRFQKLEEYVDSNKRQYNEFFRIGTDMIKRGASEAEIKMTGEILAHFDDVDAKIRLDLLGRKLYGKDYKHEEIPMPEQSLLEQMNQAIRAGRSFKIIDGEFEYTD
jgi:hypothetical protein